MGRLRIAVVGTGSIGRRHLGLLGSKPDVEAIAVPVRPERVGELRSAGWEAAPSLAAIEDGLNGVIVATDSERHVTDAIEAVRLGCSALVEKPLATNGDDAARIVQAGMNAGVRVFVASCLRFETGMQWVEQRIGELGQPLVADVECLSWLPAWRPDRDHRTSYSARAGAGGVMLDLIHEFDYAAWLLGPISVKGAVLSNAGIVDLPPSLDETAAIVAACGPTAVPLTIRLSYAISSSTRRLRIAGTSGVLSLDLIGKRAVMMSPDGAALDELEYGGVDTMYSDQLSAWLGDIRGDRSTGLVPAVEGARAVDVCDDVRRVACFPARGTA